MSAGATDDLSWLEGRERLKRLSGICVVKSQRTSLEWDAFLAQLNRMGLEKVLEIRQRGYDNLMNLN